MNINVLSSLSILTPIVSTRDNTIEGNHGHINTEYTNPLYLPLFFTPLSFHEGINNFYDP